MLMLLNQISKLVELLVALHQTKRFHQNLKFQLKNSFYFNFFIPVDEGAGAVAAGALPNAVVAPNGRIVDEFCKPVPNESGCDAAGAAVCAVAVGLPNVNVEFNEEGAAVPAAGVVEEPNKNPVVAGAAVVAVDVAPKAVRNKKEQNKQYRITINTYDLTVLSYQTRIDWYLRT